MLRPLCLLSLLPMLMLAGCQQDAASPEASNAEIPQPGSAIEDPGPAPEGQWEPEVGDSAAPDGSAPAGDPGADDNGSADAAPSTGDDISLRLQPWEATQELIASHKGKVVVIDFWSTSCLPCRREFPHLVALQKAHPDDVACVSVSLDYSGRKSRPPESYRDDVLAFLREQQAMIDNVLSTDDPDELEQRLDLAPIPLVWVIDRQGERRKAFDNADLQGEEFTYESDVVPYVESLLSES